MLAGKCWTLSPANICLHNYRLSFSSLVKFLDPTESFPNNQPGVTKIHRNDEISSSIL